MTSLPKPPTARDLALIATDVADVLRVTDAIMQIALCITQRIANDRSLVPGSRAQFGQALDPITILRMLIDSDIRVRRAYGCAYAATQQRRGAASIFTRNVHITVIGTPRPIDDTPWPPSPGHSPHVVDAIQAALRDIVALPAVLSVQRIRARPTTSTDRSMPKYPSSVPMMVTTRGTRTYSLSVVVLATRGEQYHPWYSILSLSALMALGDTRRTELPKPCSLPMLPLAHLILIPNTPLPLCWRIGSACPKPLQLPRDQLPVPALLSDAPTTAAWTVAVHRDE